jgi:hypothetical protein
VPNAKTAREQFKDCAPAWMTCGLDQRTWRLDVDGELARMAKAFESVSELTPGSEASPR